MEEKQKVVGEEEFEIESGASVNIRDYSPQRVQNRFDALDEDKWVDWVKLAPDGSKDFATVTRALEILSNLEHMSDKAWTDLRNGKGAFYDKMQQFPMARMPDGTTLEKFALESPGYFREITPELRDKWEAERRQAARFGQFPWYKRLWIALTNGGI